jgi:hypothetical protein
MKKITIKQHDTNQLFTDIPTIDGDYIPFGDLTGYTLSFLLKGGVVAIKKTAQIVSTTISSQAVAKFQYQPVADDVSQVVSKLKQEWELEAPDGKLLTFPNADYNEVKIIADLG